MTQPPTDNLDNIDACLKELDHYIEGQTCSTVDYLLRVEFTLQRARKEIVHLRERVDRNQLFLPCFSGQTLDV